MTKATHHFAGKGTNPADAVFFAPAPIACPFCGISTTTQQGRIVTHADPHGFMCVAVNMTLAQAASLEIDAAGRVIGADEMML